MNFFVFLLQNSNSSPMTAISHSFPSENFFKTFFVFYNGFSHSCMRYFLVVGNSSSWTVISHPLAALGVIGSVGKWNTAMLKGKSNCSLAENEKMLKCFSCSRDRKLKYLNMETIFIYPEFVLCITTNSENIQKREYLRYFLLTVLIWTVDITRTN